MSVSLVEWIKYLSCPACQGRLAPNRSQVEFRCETCDKKYPVIDGIFRSGDCFKPGDRESEIKQKEVEVRDAGAVSDDTLEGLRNAMEIPACIRAMSPCASDHVAELGCGKGRITRLYPPRGARIVAVDFSFAALQLFRRLVPEEYQERLLLAEADRSVPIPLRPQSFSKVVSFQVFEHHPTPQSRQDAVA